MRIRQLIIGSIATGLCAFAVGTAQASTTNLVTFAATTFSQGATNSSNGTNTAFGATITKARSTADILHELGNATTNSFSTAAKLVLITGNDKPQFVVVDGANVVDVHGIVSIQHPGNQKIRSGTENGQTQLAFPTLKELQIIELDFDDTSYPNGSHLNFFLIGLANVTTTDTIPSATGVYTETFKGKVTSMTGEGSSDSGSFVATGSLTVSGKSTTSLVP
jgi:hypothetical protein